MNPLSIIRINCNANFNIVSMNENGLKYLGYNNIKEIEFKSISTIIPQPSSSLHQQIFHEMSKTYTNKSKYFKITEIADESMNTGRIDAVTDTYILNKLQSKIDSKTVLTKNGIEKKAIIYVDLLTSRECNIYMYPLVEEDSTDDDNDTSQFVKVDYHPELAAYRTSALVDVLRKVKNILYK